MSDTRVVLAAAHLDGNPGNNRRHKPACAMPALHLLHDRPYHLQQRWMPYRRRWAIGDLFLGFYEVAHDMRPRSVDAFGVVEAGMHIEPPLDLG